MVYEEFCKWFGVEGKPPAKALVGSRESFAAGGAEIWNWWLDA